LITELGKRCQEMDFTYFKFEFLGAAALRPPNISPKFFRLSPLGDYVFLPHLKTSLVTAMLVL